ncbi:MAG: acyl-CoA reductase [Flavobacteriaceae bacterium]|nr:acyl-CoA reductase [Flavobacteriaceae bacterium]
MNLSERIKAFSELGLFLSQFNDNELNKNIKIDSSLNQNCFEALQMQIKRAHEYNGWFTTDNLLKAIKNWSKALTEDNLKKWTNPYRFENTTKTVAVIMAGNIPLVGFHDFLSVLISGHKIVVKQASNDSLLLPILVKFLEGCSSEFKQNIKFVTTLKDEKFDAIIATGSDNTARYFEYYFKKYPHIIRKNRNSVAVLTGKETEEELTKLGNDIFQYFGLGCRSISKLFVPNNYDFDPFFKAIYSFKDIINYKKYENNYDYNKAVYLMSLFKLTENGFLMLKEDAGYSSPIATLFYEYYDDLEVITKKLQNDSEKIQCIVSNANIKKAIAFGETQQPKLWDYADDVDTLDFLEKL